MDAANYPSVEMFGRTWKLEHPQKIRECSVCMDRLATKVFCVDSHTVCGICLPELSTCPDCRGEKCSPEHTDLLQRSVNTELSNLKFLCQTPDCNWKGEHDGIKAHVEQCVNKPTSCDYECGDSLLPSKMPEHKKNCRIRPVKVGNLETNFETLEEIKKLRKECESFSLPKADSAKDQDMVSLAHRLIKVYPLIVDSAMKESEISEQPSQATAQTSKPIVCAYLCGYIAETNREFSTHYQTCLSVPLDCRYCQKAILRKDRVPHEKLCDKRPVQCTDCNEAMPWDNLEPHVELCPLVQVPCHLCQAYLLRNKLAEHQESLCPSRAVTCDRCLESTTAGNITTHCRFTQNISLPGNGETPRVTLVPQPGSIGPIYQAGDSSTIYLATTVQRLKQKLEWKIIFPENMKCTFCDKAATLNARQGAGDAKFALKLIQDFVNNVEPKIVVSSFDIIDGNNTLIAPMGMYKYDSIGIEVNHSSNPGKAVLKVKGEIPALAYKSPDDLVLVRIARVEGESYKRT